MKEKIKQTLFKWNEKRKEREVPDWHSFFLTTAYHYAEKSPDAQTQCGCVIVKDNKQVGQGYNGWPRSSKKKNKCPFVWWKQRGDKPDKYYNNLLDKGDFDDMLPNLRDEKYPWMIHAEINAVLSCESKPEGCIAYITGPPCMDCSLFMWQVGIKKIIYLGGQHIQMLQDEEYQIHMEIFKAVVGDELEIVEYDVEHLNLDHVETMLAKLKNLKSPPKAGGV